MGRGRAAVAGGAAALAAGTLARPVLDAGVALVERSLCRTWSHPGPVDAETRALHAAIPVVDLHADSLLWGRDLLARGRRGHVDVPRLLEGGVALQVLAAAPRIGPRVRLEGNPDRGDAVALLAVAKRWPPATWRDLRARTLHFATLAAATAARSAGAFRLIRTAAELDALLAARRAGARVVGGLLAIEGAHGLPGGVDDLAAADAAGFRMVALAHFFDTAYAGSAHGVRAHGLTAQGRELVTALEARRMLVDVAHASAATIDDVLGVAQRPVVASHTGVRGTHHSPRNLADAQLRGIAATGGLVGIGFWPEATGGRDVASIVRAIAHAVEVAGEEHVALGSDWDGAVGTPWDASGLPALTAALLAAGLGEGTVRRVMGENAVTLLRRSLPPG